MAKQKGLHRLKGSLDGLNYYSTKYGDLVRRKAEIPAERRKTAPEFANTRRSNDEFGYVSTIGKLMRKGVYNITKEKAPGNTNTRLMQRLRQVIALDKTHNKGERVITAEAAGMLRGFEWDEDGAVSATLAASYEFKLDTDNNRVRFGIKGFNAGRMVNWHSRVTHVDLILGVTAIDYEADDEVSTFDGAGALSITEHRPVDVLLECAIPEDAGELIVVGLGIQMYQETNGWMNKIRTGSGYMVMEAVVRTGISQLANMPIS